jgi:hypothetical protein
MVDLRDMILVLRPRASRAQRQNRITPSAEVSHR